MYQGGRDYVRGGEGGGGGGSRREFNERIESLIDRDRDGQSSNFNSMPPRKRDGLGWKKEDKKRRAKEEERRRAKEWVPKPEEPCPPPPIVEGYALEGLEAMPSTGINYEKNIYECYVCDSFTNTEIMLNTHLEGQKHIAKLEKAGYNSFMAPRPLGPIPGIQAYQDEKWKTGEKRTLSEIDPSNKGNFYCDLCDKSFDARVVYETHVRGKPHARMKKAKEEFRQSEDLSMCCEICSYVGTSAVNLEIHMQGKKHKKRVEEAKKAVASV